MTSKHSYLRGLVTELIFNGINASLIIDDYSESSSITITILFFCPPSNRRTSIALCAWVQTDVALFQKLYFYTTLTMLNRILGYTVRSFGILTKQRIAYGISDNKGQSKTHNTPKGGAAIKDNTNSKGVTKDKVTNSRQNETNKTGTTVLQENDRKVENRENIDRMDEFGGSPNRQYPKTDKKGDVQNDPGQANTGSIPNPRK